MGARNSVSAPTTPQKKKEKKKAPVKSVRKAGGDGRLYELQSYQKTLLRHAWLKINKNQGQGGNVGSMILKRMLSKNSDIKKVFQQYVVIAGVFNFNVASGLQSHQKHSALFVQLLDMAVTHLDDLEFVGEKCQEYGAMHAQYAQYGMSRVQWDTFGEAITESSREWEGWKTHRETLKAWTLLVSFLVDRLTQGYEQAARKTTVTFASQPSTSSAHQDSPEPGTPNDDSTSHQQSSSVKHISSHVPVPNRAALCPQSATKATAQRKHSPGGRQKHTSTEDRRGSCEQPLSSSCQDGQRLPRHQQQLENMQRHASDSVIGEECEREPTADRD